MSPTGTAGRTSDDQRHHVLDGFIADLDDRVEKIFGWCDAGPVEVPSAYEDNNFRLREASATYCRR